MGTVLWPVGKSPLGPPSEWMKLAELALVMVPGSVKDERVFSEMDYIKDARRNRLQNPHLSACEL
jgi:hypothetical protein